MKAAIGLTGAFGLFAAAFALHIVGGASGQRWLFAIAVALIYLTATGFAAISLAIAGFDRHSLAGRRQIAAQDRAGEAREKGTTRRHREDAGAVRRFRIGPA